MAEDITLSPHKGPQSEFLSTRADICIFGGSAGGEVVATFLREKSK